MAEPVVPIKASGGPGPRDVIFGAAPLAGIFAPVSRESAHEAIRRAVELGVVDFDTAPFYGGGASEERLGEVLPQLGPEIRIATKVGRVLKPEGECPRGSDPKAEWSMYDLFCLDGEAKPDKVPYPDYSSAGAREAYEGSLARLGMGIKVLRVHDCESEERYARVAQPDNAVEELVRLRAEGKIERVSLGMNRPDYILRFLRDFPQGTFDEVLMAGSWNLIDQSGAEVLEVCGRMGVDVVIAGVFASGLLWGRRKYKYEDAEGAHLELLSKWEALAKEHSVPLPAVAMQFSFLPKCVSQVCLGLRSAEEVGVNLDLLGAKVPVELWREAQSKGMLPSWIDFASRSEA